MNCRPVATIVSLGALLTIAACGSSSSTPSTSSPAGNGEAVKDAPAILADAISATGSAGSAHMKADFGGTGFDGDVNSGAYMGSFTSGPGKTLQIAIKGNQAWMKAAAAFWASQTGEQAVASCFADKWVNVPADNAAAQQLVTVTNFTDLKKFADSLNTGASNVTKGATTTINGNSVIELKGKDGVLFVATEGKPYIIELKGTNTSTPSPGGTPDPTANATVTIDFSNYEKTPVINAPADALPITTTAAACAAAAPPAAATPTP